VGTRAILDAVVKRKIPSRESNPRTPIVQPEIPALLDGEESFLITEKSNCSAGQDILSSSLEPKASLHVPENPPFYVS
jgi:hypothetical protein